MRHKGCFGWRRVVAGSFVSGVRRGEKCLSHRRGLYRSLRLESLENRDLLSVAQLVGDINREVGDSYPSDLTDVNGTLYFSAYDGMDRKLWKYDGSQLTKIDVNPAGSSYFENLTNVNGTLYFSAYDGTDQELWKYDGSNAAKIDINPSGDSNPESLTNVNGILYFAAYDGTDQELWKYVGSNATKIDINPSGNSNPESLTNVNGILYFAAYDGTDQELWKYDGSTATKIDINPAGNSNPHNLTNIAGILYFAAYDGTDQELWKYDGSNTTKIDINPSGDSNPESLTNVNGILYFAAYDGTDQELWKYDGSNATKIDINPVGDFNPDYLTYVNGILYFMANDGTNLWKYDGAKATEIVLNPSGNSNPYNLTDVNGILYFAAYDGTDRELWKYGGSNAVKIDINPSDDSDPESLTNVNGILYFAAYDGTDQELWKYDGSNAAKIDINPSGDSNPESLTNVNGILYFVAYDGTDQELWKYDGITATKIDINLSGDSWPYDLTNVNGILYFSAYDEADQELWKYDGSTATKIDVNPSGDSNSHNLTNVAGTLYFAAYDETSSALWKYDGGALTKIDSDPSGSYTPESLTNVNGTVYFLTYDMFFSELWKCDGTTAISTGITAGGIDGGMVSLTNVDGVLYLSASIDGERELWGYDGATATKIDINPAGSSDPENLTNVNGTLYFSAYDGMDQELWKYDGSAATKIDINPSGQSRPYNLTNVNGILYFSAFHPETGYELWKLSAAPNTAPALGDATLVPVAEDAANPPGDTLDSICAGKFIDPDAGSRLAGIAVVANTANATTEGVWQYCTDGAHWLDVGSVNDTGSGLALASATRVRFVPVADDYGAVSGLTVRGLDDTYAGSFSKFDGAAETRVAINTTNHGGSTAIAGAVTELSTSVTPVNDRPSFAASSPNTVDTNAGPQVVNGWVKSFSPGPANESSQKVKAYLVGEVSNPALFSVPPAVNTDGTLSYTPAIAAFGTSTFNVAVQDNAGMDHDGFDTSASQTFTITVDPPENMPGLTGIEPTTLSYMEKVPATAITATTIACDTSWPNLIGATIQITGSYQKGQDVLSFANTKNIKGAFDAKTGKLTLSGTDSVANYQAALWTVKYQNTSVNPIAAVRTVTFQVKDAKASSNKVTRTIAVTPVDDPPVAAKIEAKALAYVEKQAAAVVSKSITVGDVDNANLAGATVQITGNYKKGQDLLMFVDTATVKATWAAETGKLTLSGSDTLANYQKALRAVKYQNASANPSTDTRTVTFRVSDGPTTSNAVTRNITLKAVNDAPVLAGIEGIPMSYAKNQSAAPITTTITASDVDNANLASATVQITGNYKKGQDVLAFANTATITGSFDAKTGKLTLTGIDTVANYLAALRAVTYQNTSASPSTAVRTVTFKVFDGLTSSKGVTRSIQLTNSVVPAGVASIISVNQGTKPAANDAALSAMFWSIENPDHQ